MTVIHKEYLVDSSGTDQLLCGMRREPSSRYTRWWTTVSCKNCLKKRKVRGHIVPNNRQEIDMDHELAMFSKLLLADKTEYAPPLTKWRKFYLWLADAMQN